MSGLAEERLEVLAEHLRLPDLPVLLPQIAEGAVAGEHFNALHRGAARRLRRGLRQA